MTLVEAFKNVYYHEIFSVSSRASRKEYFGSLIIFLPLSLIITIISYYISDFIGDLVLNILTLVNWIAVITVNIRRAHDVNKSGWYMIIPIYGFVLSISRSHQASNKWGDPRKHTIIRSI